MNPFNTFVLGFGRDFYFQPCGNTIPVKKYAIVTSSAASPIVMTTATNHSIQTNDKVVLFLHSGNDAVYDDSTHTGNWLATRIDSNTLSLQGSTGLNIGTGGFIALCNDGTGVTGLTCLIKESHTEGATINITKTGSWTTQNRFLFYFSFSATDIANLTPGRSYARSVYYTDASGNKQLLLSDTVEVLSR